MTRVAWDKATAMCPCYILGNTRVPFTLTHRHLGHVIFGKTATHTLLCTNLLKGPDPIRASVICWVKNKLVHAHKFFSPLTHMNSYAKYSTPIFNQIHRHSSTNTMARCFLNIGFSNTAFWSVGLWESHTTQKTWSITHTNTNKNEWQMKPDSLVCAYAYRSDVLTGRSRGRSMRKTGRLDCLKKKWRSSSKPRRAPMLTKSLQCNSLWWGCVVWLHVAA